VERALHARPPAELAGLLEAADVRMVVSDRRADVVLDAPERRNAQTPTTWRALAAVGDWLVSRVDVVVLRATGPSFSAGLDRRAFVPAGLPELDLTSLAALPDAELDARVAAFQDGFAWWSGPGPVTVAVVQGPAVGAGFQLALACDLRVAGPGARFCMRETSLGLVPDLGGTGPLVRAVGYSRALEICATGRWVDAVEAADLGLVQSVATEHGLDHAVDTLVAALLAAPAPALRATRTLLREAAVRDPGDQRAAERAAQLPLLRGLAAERSSP
jgi:enoyl-CoA hydratase/carnithine racemase